MPLRRRLFMTPIGFDERLASAAQQLVRAGGQSLGWPPGTAPPDSGGQTQPLQPGASGSRACALTPCIRAGAIS